MLVGFFFLGGDVWIAMLANLGMLSFSFHHKPRTIDFVILSLVVFGIYILDRSLDAKKEVTSDQSKRGQFFLPILRYTQPTGILSLTISLMLALFFYDMHFLIGGFLLGGLVGGYLLCYHYFAWRYFPKELIIALLYCLGVSYPIFSFAKTESWQDYSVYSLFFFSIYAEVIQLSILDASWDTNYKRTTIINLLGLPKTILFHYFILGIGVVISAILLKANNHLMYVGIGFLLFFCFSAFLTKFIYRFPHWIQKIFCELSFTPFLVFYLL